MSAWSSAIKKQTAVLPNTQYFPLKTIDRSRIVTIDFETFFDADYTLRKMSTSEYVRDKRFKSQMMGIKVGNKPTRIIPTNRIQTELKKINWATHTLLCHNTAFDGFILSHHYGVIPVYYLDTLSMARGLHSNDISAGLDEVAQYYSKGNKIADVLERTKGVLVWDKQLYADASRYCTQDVDLTFDIFECMHPQMPADEMDLIHYTCQMFCDPVLKVDIPRVEKELARELDYRKELMASVIDIPSYADAKLLKGKEKLLSNEERDTLTVKRVIGSNERFAELLRAEGIDPPVKISPAWIKKPVTERLDEDKWGYAFAKDDADFINLPEQIDVWGSVYNLNKKRDMDAMLVKQARIKNLVECRLAVKSTTNVTRAERFLTAGANGMSLPVGYAYYRAHCLTGDAQVLTREGWQRLDEWRGGDIAQWSPDGATVFKNATPNVFGVDEDLVIAKARYHHASYTQGHTLPGFTPYGKFVPRQAGHAAEGRFNLPISGTLDGDACVTHLDVQLAVMVQADGNIRTSGRSGRCVRFGFTKPRKIARCSALLTEANVPFTQTIETRGTTCFYIGAKDMHRVLGLLDENTKEFLPAIYNAPLDVKHSFINELTHWDGDVEPHRKGFTYSTTNKANAETVQTIAHLTGQSAFLSKRTRQSKKWADSYRVYIRSDKSTRSESKHYSTCRYSGNVYCPTTETGFFLMRQNGLIVVTGNTGRFGGNNKMNMQNLTRGGELRLSILAPDGHQLVVQDSGQIEARVNGWLWGQDDLLDAFRAADAGTGRDAYCNFADHIYGREITKADTMERFVGKVCIAEGELVLTDRGLVPINLISKIDRLWDGVEWVTHDGVIDQGIKEVITYDGLTATFDHEVFTEDGRIIPLGQAASEMARLQNTGAEGQSLRFCDDHVVADTPRKRLSVRVGQVHPERSNQVNLPQQLEERKDNLVLKEWTTANSSREGSGQPLRRDRSAVQQSVTQALGELRRAGHQMPVHDQDGIHPMGLDELTTRGLQRCGDRPGKQQRELRTGEFEIGDQNSAKPEQAQHPDDSLAGTAGLDSRVCQPLESDVHVQTIENGADGRTNPREVRTFDIVNAGPRRRYTVSGKLCLNCVLGLGFQMGAPKFQLTLAKGALGGPPVFFELDRCKGIVNTYRRQNNRIQNGWEICKGIIEDMAAGVEGEHGPIRWEKERIWLPNGMCLKYPDLKVRTGEKGWDEWSYDAAGIRKKIYGGLLCENLVQALARIIVNWQMLQAAKRMRIVMITHDENVACVKTKNAPLALEIMEACMRTAPDWCPDIPLNSEGGFAANYSK